MFLDCLFLLKFEHEKQWKFRREGKKPCKNLLQNWLLEHNVLENVTFSLQFEIHEKHSFSLCRYLESIDPILWKNGNEFPCIRIMPNLHVINFVLKIVNIQMLAQTKTTLIQICKMICFLFFFLSLVVGVAANCSAIEKDIRNKLLLQAGRIQKTSNKLWIFLFSLVSFLWLTFFFPFCRRSENLSLNFGVFFLFW